MITEFISEALLAPLVQALGGLVVIVLLWVVRLLVKKANQKWNLDIDLREQQLLEALAGDVVHYVEATIPGQKRGEEKRDVALKDLVARAAQVGLDIGEDVARRKIEKALSRDGLKGLRMVGAIGPLQRDGEGVG